MAVAKTSLHSSCMSKLCPRDSYQLDLNSRFPPELISFQFQQHVVPNRQVQYSKNRATGGNMDRAMKTVPSLIWSTPVKLVQTAKLRFFQRRSTRTGPDWAPSRINPLAEYAIVENHQVH